MSPEKLNIWRHLQWSRREWSRGIDSCGLGPYTDPLAQWTTWRVPMVPLLNYWSTGLLHHCTTAPPGLETPGPCTPISQLQFHLILHYLIILHIIAHHKTCRFYQIIQSPCKKQMSLARKLHYNYSINTNYTLSNVLGFICESKAAQVDADVNRRFLKD